MYDMLAVRLDPDLEERLTFMAKRSGRSKSDFVRRAIEDRIEEMECVALLEEAMRDPDAGKTRPLEDVIRELGLDA
jgi:RHH-type transcriptional regulator, rel operon repressor / antitoxin RelB